MLINLCPEVGVAQSDGSGPGTAFLVVIARTVPYVISGRKLSQVPLKSGRLKTSTGRRSQVSIVTCDVKVKVTQVNVLKCESMED